MKRIILAGLLSEQNLGDIIIADGVKFLYNEQTKNVQDVEYIGLDLAGYTDSLHNRPSIIKKLDVAWNRLLIKLGVNFSERLRKKHIKYYEPLIKGADLIIVVGGGMIKYKLQYCWVYLNGLISAAEKHKIIVALNALGVEGYNDQQIKCQYLKRALNSPAVKVITTRDDIDTLKNLYLKNNNDIISYRVADPGVFAASVYGVKKIMSSNIVGVGLIRGDIFKAYYQKITREDLITLYAGILSELDKRRMVWKVFTNGLPSDLELAEEIFNRVGKAGEIKNILVPGTAKELVKIISGFKGVIAARLHACIVSYSLEIPAIGLVWNNKLSLFGKSIGYPDRFIVSTKFGDAYIVDQLEKAMLEGYDLQEMQAYKKTTTDSVRQILEINNILQ